MVSSDEPEVLILLWLNLTIISFMVCLYIVALKNSFYLEVIKVFYIRYFINLGLAFVYGTFLNFQIPRGFLVIFLF